MTDEELKSYQELRASNGLPEISNQEALVEAQALINFAEFAFRSFCDPNCPVRKSFFDSQK